MNTPTAEPDPAVTVTVTVTASPGSKALGLVVTDMFWLPSL
jgi:hypothetical protein